AEFPESGQVALVGHVDASLALNRLDQDGRRPAVDRPLHRPEVVVGYVLEAGHERLEAVLVLLLARRAEGGERPAVERVARRDDLVAVAREPLLRVLPRELERGLVGLRPRVAEEDPVGERVLHEELGQVDLGRRVEQVRHVQQRPRRLLDGAGHAGMAVPERHDREPRREVEVLPAVGVPHAQALAADEADRRPSVGVRVVPGRPFEQRARVRHSVISVPIPSLVNSSSRIAWGVRPSMLWALAVPPSRARSDDSTFGSIPPSMTPASISRAASFSVSVLRRVPSWSRMPPTSVRWTSFSAWRAAAIWPATRSALML